MKIELRKIHYSKALSQETSAYTAEVWIDGKKRGTVENHGTGGPDEIHPRSLADEIEAYAKTLPHEQHFGQDLPMCAEILFGALLDEHLARKDFKSALRRKVLFTKTDGKLYEIRGAGPRTTRTERPDVVTVLNDLPFEEAFAIYRRLA